MSGSNVAEKYRVERRDTRVVPRRVQATSRALKVLLVEDNRGDELLARNSVAATNITHDVHCIRRGGDVIPYLEHCTRLGQHSLPDLIMLDLGMPNVDGFDVLKALSQTTAAIRSIPLVILTGYRDFKNAFDVYELSVMAYLQKPCDPNVLREILLALRFPNE